MIFLFLYIVFIFSINDGYATAESQVYTPPQEQDHILTYSSGAGILAICIGNAPKPQVGVANKGKSDFYAAKYFTDFVACPSIHSQRGTSLKK